MDGVEPATGSTWPVEGHDDAAAPLCARYSEVLLQHLEQPEAVDVRNARLVGRHRRPHVLDLHLYNVFA